ncbi:MAG TPA: substrate-binding domain-containing protein [Actinocrinis sp.]|uniref:substrate-binding domain-containing protein n=1 Tax=Actinocrinis sp. TaxID=1920516 RepID=UPI002DDD707F|nr:substrate-binding domain-containing protein [Actinocrinis sp.]HEV2343751.1 substrate-binding domain-containing protein [Actinocrinis sp.]
MRPRSIRRFAAMLAAALTVATVPVAPAHAVSYVPLQGDGSSWAEPAIAQWARDMVTQGIQISYTGDGSAQGREHYIENQNDFAGSDIAFLKQGDPFNPGVENVGWNFSYIPIVAGGTTFVYNLVVGGQKIRNLRLSGLTLARIFTGSITNWSDPAITRDYGVQLPSQPITVITRSDGSGASYMFTRWLSKQYSSLWNGFCQAHGGPSPCGPTEFYPGFGGSIQKDGSDQVATFLASPISEGSIGYDEYAYALNYSLPAVKMLNSAGYYTLPTPSNVAIALQAAIIDENPSDVDFLMQNLDNVYAYSDPRTYPLSSYSYLIIPRDVGGGGNNQPPPNWNTQKGVTLGTWLNYVLCGAQSSAGVLGYSPLPKNLVVGGFTQVDHMPGHVPTPDLNQLNGCDNPTYSNGVNHLIVDAPMPSPCDKVTAPLNCAVRNGEAVNTGSGSGTGGGSGGSGGNGTTGGPTSGAGPSSSAAGNGAGSGGGTIDPNTGQILTSGFNNGGPQAVYAEPVAVAGSSDQQIILAILTVLELLAAIAVPSSIGIWLQRRRKQG